MQRSLSAAGKLFLSGEYAVLWGGQARVVCVGPRSHALIRRNPDPEVHLLLEEGRCTGRVTPAGIGGLPRPLPEPFRVIAFTLDLSLRTPARENIGFSFAVSSSPRAPNGDKLGLGGSARAAVLSAEAARYVLEQKWDPLKLALLAHSEAQGGKGSGADVAAIFAGGFIRYRRYDVSPLAKAALGGRLGAALLTASPVDVLRLSPPKVALSYVFTGTSASTPSLIREIESRLDADARQRFVDDSDVLGARMEEALLRGDFDQLTSACQELQAKLCALGPLETQGMKRALALAQATESTGKLSGAGGGDGCVLFSPDAETRAVLLESLKERGLFAIPLELEPGMKGEVAAEPTLQRWLSL
jgi:phosphomevalonate kinase